jgi:glycosyltransferase involved in cell wall biosynthesis
MKIAFVVQRYGEEINGGAELHCRYVAKHLAKYADVEIFTTCAQDYITWRNRYPEGPGSLDGLTVRRFPVERERNPNSFGRIQEDLLCYPHQQADELRWMDEQGPYCPGMIRYIKQNQQRYNFFIFFSYRYYHSFHGIRTVPHKSLLVPTAEEDPIIHFPIFRGLFHLPQGFVYNSVEERRLIQWISSNYQVPGDVVGVGSEVPRSADGQAFRRKFNLNSPFLLYIGRIDENKGCGQLFDYFLRFQNETGSPLKLVTIGSPILKIPDDPRIISTGFLEDTDKFNALQACDTLMMPSFYESLSMVLLEAWAMGRPTLANANCRVLMGQSIRSNAGLFYSDYPEFKRALNFLQQSPDVRELLGRNGKKFYEENYRWEIIERKYMNLMNSLRN